MNAVFSLPLSWAIEPIWERLDTMLQKRVSAEQWRVYLNLPVPEKNSCRGHLGQQAMKAVFGG